ncbi:MAG: Mitomycin resistance protein mcrB [Vampirovibrionales bacterium]|nr:Mitomycin resistance protein mcrB [Vampirovibrionales bacterium]
MSRRPASRKPASGLGSLANIGPAALRDFSVLGIETIAALAACDADDLYRRLASLTGARHDPCVRDVFRAAIHEAQTGEKTHWSQWTAERKALNPP